MTSIDDVFSSNSLKAEDIDGREPTVIISKVEVKEFKNRDGSPQRKLVISFQGAKKTLVCNRTNAQRISFMHGKDYTQWTGKQITLFVDPFVQFGNEMTKAIRIKPPQTAQAAPATVPAPVHAPAPQAHDGIDPPFSDDIPF